MKNFWMISLCALLIIASVIGWNIPIRIAVGANAVLILINVIYNLKGYINQQKSYKNEKQQ